MPALLLYIVLLLRVAVAGVLTVEVLDVGQGDSILIETPKGKRVLIDAGTSRSGVVRMLRRRGIDRLDLVVATHAHADHIGGMDEVLEAIPVRFFADSGVVHTTATYNRVMQLVEELGIPYRAAKVGQTWRLDDKILIEVLHPHEQLLRGTRSDLNSNSVVLRLTHGRNCFLFAGDSEEPTERMIVQDHPGPCQVLKVAHHGGAHSSAEAFLAEVQPEIAVISSGVGNSYGHPTPEAIGRLEAVGATVWRTDQQGTITIKSNKRRLKVSAAPEPVDALIDVTGRASLPRPVATAVDRLRPAAPASPGDTAPDGALLDINTATVVQLDALPGIGVTRATAIFSWVRTDGPCTDLDQLDDAPGIGPATIEGLRGLATCSPPTEAPSR